MLNILQEKEWLESAVIRFRIDEGEYTEEQAKEKFKISSLESASWAFRKIRALNESIAETKKLAEIESKRINEWEKKATQDDERSIAFFEYLLTEYFLTKKAEDPQFKLSTPYGKVSSRKQQDKWVYDDKTIINNLKERKLNKFIRIKEEVNKADLKKEVEVLENVCVLNGEILGHVNIEKPDGADCIVIRAIGIDTGEVYDSAEKDYEFYEQAIVYDGKVIEGIMVEPQPDAINIKVEV